MEAANENPFVSSKVIYDFDVFIDGAKIKELILRLKDLQCTE